MRWSFGGAAETGTAGDLTPEGLKFVAAADSPTGAPLLLVTNKLSGIMAVCAIEP